MDILQSVSLNVIKKRCTIEWVGNTKMVLKILKTTLEFHGHYCIFNVHLGDAGV